nr:histidine phosphatase family protein [uncultured Rhodopila sp.]
MPTTKIMVIRHAEKPNGGPGLMPDGTQNPEALTATGWKRAEALAGLFDPPGGRFADARLATPATIFASGVAHHSDSLRPQQTVTPLAAKLAQQIDRKYAKGDEARLVREATRAGGVVLIAWQHEAIPEIALLIRGSDEGIPSRWPPARFDLVWVFDRPGGSGSWDFAQVPQNLLPGDSPEPIAVS